MKNFYLLYALNICLLGGGVCLVQEMHGSVAPSQATSVEKKSLLKRSWLSNSDGVVPHGNTLKSLTEREILKYKSLFNLHGQNRLWICQRPSSPDEESPEYSPEHYKDKMLENFKDECWRRLPEIGACANIIKEIKDTSLENIATELIEQFHDPIGIVCLAQTSKIIFSDRCNCVIDGQELLNMLLKLGAEPTKVFDYAQKYLSDRTSSCYYSIQKPPFMQLNIPEAFPVQSKSESDAQLGEAIGRFSDVGTRLVIEKIGSYLDEKSFLNFSLTSKTVRAVLLNSVSSAIPPRLIPSRTLDSEPLNFIKAADMTEAELLKALSCGISAHRPNVGIAIDFEGYKDDVSTHTIDTLSKYPIVALYCSGRNVAVMFPDGIEQLARLPRLRELYLRDMQIKTFPSQLCRLRELVHLNMSINEIKELPEEIGTLARLKFFDISYNQLVTLPQNIGNLHQLRMLILKGNSLRELPDSIGQLQQLQLLVLGGADIASPMGNLSALPHSIGALKNLRWLHVPYNGLKEIPESIGNLNKLLELDLHANKLTHIPLTMNGLTSLKILDIASNQLSVFPERELNGLANLRVLNIYDNKIPGIDVYNGLLYVFDGELKKQDVDYLGCEDLTAFLKNIKNITFRSAFLRLLLQYCQLHDEKKVLLTCKGEKAFFCKPVLTPSEAMQLNVFCKSGNIDALIDLIKKLDCLKGLK